MGGQAGPTAKAEGRKEPSVPYPFCRQETRAERLAERAARRAEGPRPRCSAVSSAVGEVEEKLERFKCCGYCWSLRAGTDWLCDPSELITPFVLLVGKCSE